MRTTLEESGWARGSRFAGAMRYYRAAFGQMLLWIMVALAVIQVIAIAMMAFGQQSESGGVSANFSLTLLAAFMSAVWVADKGTTFLCRYGAARTPVWLGGLCSLMVWMLALLVCTLALGVVTSGAILLLNGADPARFRLVSYTNEALTSAEVYQTSLMESLRALPWHALWLCEWCCVFFFIGACLRRNKWLTIAVMVGLPMAGLITMVVPTVREAVAALQTANESQIASMGFKWLGWLSRLAQWVKDNWQWLQAGLAVASLPLGWWIARRTPQP